MESVIFNKYFISILIVLAAVSGGLAWLINKGLNENVDPNTALFIPRGGEYRIELRDDGFYPNELKIKRGGIITFSTTRDKHFWPASNLHPTHTIYPEFDPAEPIPPDQNWGFQFNKAGTWRYHDHLAPYFRGTIVVIE